jgi:hypothetical protein
LALLEKANNLGVEILKAAKGESVEWEGGIGSFACIERGRCAGGWAWRRDGLLEARKGLLRLNTIRRRGQRVLKILKVAVQNGGKGGVGLVGWRGTCLGMWAWVTGGVWRPNPALGGVHIES